MSQQVRKNILDCEEFITIKAHGLQHTTATLHIVYTHILSFKWAIISTFTSKYSGLDHMKWVGLFAICLICLFTFLAPVIVLNVKLMTLWWVQCHRHCHKWWPPVIHKHYHLWSKLYCLSFPLAQREMMHFNHNHNHCVTAHLNDRIQRKATATTVAMILFWDGFMWAHGKCVVNSAHSRSNTVRTAVCSHRGQITYHRFIRGICFQSAATEVNRTNWIITPVWMWMFLPYHKNQWFTPELQQIIWNHMYVMSSCAMVSSC